MHEITESNEIVSDFAYNVNAVPKQKIRTRCGFFLNYTMPIALRK